MENDNEIKRMIISLAKRYGFSSEAVKMGMEVFGPALLLQTLQNQKSREKWRKQSDEISQVNKLLGSLAEQELSGDEVELLQNSWQEFIESVQQKNEQTPGSKYWTGRSKGRKNKKVKSGSRFFFGDKVQTHKTQKQHADHFWEPK